MNYYLFEVLLVLAGNILPPTQNYNNIIASRYANRGKNHSSNHYFDNYGHIRDNSNNNEPINIHTISKKLLITMSVNNSRRKCAENEI
mgnify:CR=1 FL=1